MNKHEWNQTVDLQCGDPCIKPRIPCAIVVFGASGDLTSRKLLPALYCLYQNDYLPEKFALLGCSRTKFTDESFREHLYKHIASIEGCTKEDWNIFAKNIHYQQIDYNNPDDGKKLNTKLKKIDFDHGTAGNRLFYMAVPPLLYESVSSLIHQGQLKADCPQNECWSRIIVEKPYGQNLSTAVKLDKTLKQTFT